MIANKHMMIQQMIKFANVILIIKHFIILFYARAEAEHRW